MSTKVRVQVDTENLLALLSDDPEVQLEIRSTIVQQFTQKYLKGIVNTEAVRESERALKAGIKEYVQEAMGTFNYFDFKPSPQFARQFEDMAEQYVTFHVRRAVEEAVERRLPRIDDLVGAQIQGTVRKMVDDEVKRRLSRALTLDTDGGCSQCEEETDGNS